MLTRTTARRRGMTTVETALVLVVFCMLMFGVFEYCRFLYMLHLTNNAARDGARYAVVNLSKPTTFDKTDFTDGSGTVYPSIQKYTTARMSGSDRQLGNYAVAVYPVDPVGAALPVPIIRPKTTASGTGGPYPDPFNPADPYRTPWNQASFTEGVAVTVRGDYRPIAPSFFFIPSVIPMRITAIAGSEG